MRNTPLQVQSRHTASAFWPRGAVMAAVALLLGACGGVKPTSTPSMNEKIAWTGYVFEARDEPVVADLLSQDRARQLVAEYDPELEIVAVHAGELAPNVSGPSYLGYVVEAVRSGDPEPKVLLINAEEGELSAGPGVRPGGDQ